MEITPRIGHVIHLEGREQPFVVSRTNNLAEHRFGTTKRGVRRKIGVNKLTGYVQAMRAEELWQAYLALGGTLDPEPDTQSLFFDTDEWRTEFAHGRPGVRVVRRSGV